MYPIFLPRTCLNKNNRVICEGFVFPAETAEKLADLGYTVLVDAYRKVFYVDQSMDNQQIFDLLKKAVQIDRALVYEKADFILEGYTLRPHSDRAKAYWADWQGDLVASINLDGDRIVRWLEARGYTVGRI